MSEPFPLPGEDFNRRKLVLRRPSKAVIRINKTRFSNPLFWSRQGKYRFDSTKAPYGVLYAASDVEGAILEVFADVWLEDHEKNFSSLTGNVRGRRNPCFYRSPVGQHAWQATESAWRRFSPVCLNRVPFMHGAWGRAFMTHPGEPDKYHSRKNPRKFNYAFFEKDSAAISFQIANQFAAYNSPRS